MVISVMGRKSIRDKVFQRIGGCSYYSHGSENYHKRCRNDIDYDYDEDGKTELVQIGAERTKNVLILMSDTGGGHRASAEAIRDAFKIEFGDEYKVIFVICVFSIMSLKFGHPLFLSLKTFFLLCV